MKTFVALLTGGLVLSSSTFALAAPTIYATRAALDGAFPGLGVETFSGLASNVGCPSPLGSTTPSNDCFNQGALRTGFTVGGVDSHPTDGVALNAGPTGRFIATSYYADTTVLAVSPPQYVVGFDLFVVGGGSVLLTDGTTATVTVYDEGQNVVATQDVASGAFFGIRSDTRIGRVELLRPGTYIEGIDNLVLGPSFATITPATGGYRGGNTVTVTGEGFAAATTVAFGGVAATDVVVTAGTSLTCKAPAHAAGPVDVAVTTSGVTLTKSASYTYVAHTASATLSLEPKTPRYADEPNTFTATVTGVSPTGSVTLVEGTTQLAKGTVSAGGTMLAALLPAGSHTVFAHYEGDAFHAEVDSAPVMLDVVARPIPGNDAGVDSGASGADAGVPSNGGASSSGGAADAGDASTATPADDGGCSSSPGPRTPLAEIGLALACAALVGARRRFSARR